MTRDELVRILDERPRRLRDIHAAHLDLSGCYMADIEFENCDFSNATLPNCDLQSAHFFQCNFNGAVLDGTNFRKAHVHDSSLQDANLRGANLRRTDFDSVSLRNADLRDADLTSAGFGKLDVRGADFTGAIFYDTIMEGVLAHGARGVWFRPNETWIKDLDMSEAGDGSDMREASALIDHENGKPRPIHVRLTAFADVIREEPNAREHDIKYDELPIGDKLRGALRDWQNTLADAYDGADTADPAKLDVADRQGREVWRALSAVLKDHRIRYEPPHEDAVIEDAPEESARA